MTAIWEYAARDFEVPRPPTWRKVARPEQLPPAGSWLTWAYIAGRGAGKTRSASEWVHEKAQENPGARIALVGRTPADVRDVMIEGESGILAVAGVDAPIYQSTKRRLTWPNGSTAHTYSAEVPAQLRGPQHHFAWCFPAGTLIRTPSGERCIEALEPGDLVMTRGGPRPVLRTGSRWAPLATLHYGDGRTLTGTMEHPVWTQNRGWRALSDLVAGDKLFTWADDGESTSADTDTDTRAAASYGAIAKYGKSTTVRFRPAIRFTTLITSPVTTGSRTSKFSLLHSIGSTTHTTAPSALVGTVVPISSTRRTVDRPNTANPASRRSQRRAESGISETVSTAESSSGRREDASVVSGVSISGLVGHVHNLSVEGEREYFANDVLVHNCDEPASWTDASKGDALDTAWNNLMLGLRLGTSPRCVATTTPKPNALIRAILGRPTTAVTRGTTYDNLANLAPSFRDEVLATYEGTRIGRQELLGELLTDVEGALWTITMVDEDRVTTAPDMRRIVVAIDPSGGSGPNNDEQGIVVAGTGVDGDLYVIADRSCSLSPHGWASRAIGAFREFEADRIVAEKNYGGDMVESTIRQVDTDVPVKVITASRGKVQRAEPVAALYEQRRVHHVGALPKLEDQMTTWTPQDGTSPDRLDALVWAVTELTDNFSAQQWIDYARRKAEAAAASTQQEEEPAAGQGESNSSAEPEDPAAARQRARNAAYRSQYPR